MLLRTSLLRGHPEWRQLALSVLCPLWQWILSTALESRHRAPYFAVDSSKARIVQWLIKHVLAALKLSGPTVLHWIGSKVYYRASMLCVSNFSSSLLFGGFKNNFNQEIMASCIFSESKSHIRASKLPIWNCNAYSPSPSPYKARLVPNVVLGAPLYRPWFSSMRCECWSWGRGNWLICSEAFLFLFCWELLIGFPRFEVHSNLWMQQCRKGVCALLPT